MLNAGDACVGLSRLRPWRSPPPPPSASVFLWQATAFTTPPFLLCHLTSQFLAPDLTSTRDSDTAAAMLPALAEWLTTCPTGGSALIILPTRFCPMMRFDFDPNSAWGRGGEVTAALPDGAPAATITVATTGAKRRSRGQNGAIRDKTLANISVGGLQSCMTALRAQTRVLASGGPTIRRTGRGRRVGGGWRCG